MKVAVVVMVAEQLVFMRLSGVNNVSNGKVLKMWREVFLEGR